MRRNWLFGGALLLFALVCLYPLLTLFWGTLFTPEGFTLSRYQGLLLLTPRQWALLGRSIVFAAGSSLVSFLVAFPLAVLLGRSNCPLRKLFSWLLLVPLLIPPHASAIAWLSLLGKESILRDLVPGLDGVSPYNLLGAVLIFGVSLFPLVPIILLSGLQQIDPSEHSASWIFPC